MKASLWGQARYIGPVPATGRWPLAPVHYETALGRASYEMSIELLELGDELGYDWISFAEHHYTAGRLTPSPILMATYMASRVRRAKIALLGPLVPTQNPVRIAEETAMLDNLCGGRLVVGLLRGTPNEYQVVGVNPAETRARTQEGIELIIKAWTSPQPFGWEGVYYRYRSVSVWPRPLQQPHPPLYALGTSMETAEFAARHHLGLGISYEPFDFAAEQSRHYFEHCGLNGWQPGPDGVVFRGRVFMTETEEHAERLRELLEARARHQPHASRLTEYVEKIESSRRSVSHYGLGPVANFIGTPQQVLSQLKQAHDVAGIGVVDLAFDPPPDETGDATALHKRLMRSVELFGQEVLPAMRDI